MTLNVALILAVLVLLPFDAKAQSWGKNAVSDPLRETSFVRFTLTGKFLVPPRRSSLAKPAIVVECQPGRHNFTRTKGHFLAGWIDTGAVLDSVVSQSGSPPQLESGATLPDVVQVEYRRDGEKKLQEDSWPTAQNATSAYLSMPPFCGGGCTLAELLYGHIVPSAEKLAPVHKLIIGLPEYQGGEIEMQFDIPDPREVGDTCGIIRYSKKDWKAQK
jgi:hypothetical protein